MNKQVKRITFNKFGFLFIVFLFLLIIVRIFYVALSPTVDGTNIKTFAENRNTKIETLYASRGKILDYSGEILAQNVTSYTVIAYLSPSRTKKANNPQHVVDKEMTAEKLAPIINMDVDAILKLLNKDLYQVELGPGGRGITELVKKSIEELELPGIDFIKSEKRNYPYNSFASYLIGYAKKKDTDDEIKGEMGIESYYNDSLKGTDGKKIYQQDVNGYQIADTPVIENDPVNGMDIYLTIDEKIQMFLENALKDLVTDYDPNWAILTVMDAKTGAVVGSATMPSFDPNNLNTLKNYNNPLISYAYEPGSTMKIFSYMAAMENGTYDGDALYHSGTIQVADKTIKDHNTVGWGDISYKTGFTYSSNVAATLLAQEVGKDKLKDYYKALGFSKKTGIELSNELSGKVNFKYDVEFANASFGQGITVTPIQMLQAMTVITNNGVMLKPYIVSKIVDPNTNEVVFEGKKTELGTVANMDTVNQIKELMYLTVNGGERVTGKYYKTDNITLIGKTGTAEKVGSNGKYESGKYNYIRSFLGCFPMDNPEYIIYIVTDNLKGAGTALGKTIKTVVENISKNKFLSDEISNDKSDIYEVPSFISSTVSNAVNELTDNGINYIILGDGDYIINQYPNKSSKIYKEDKVLLLTNANTINMPNILGWSSTETSALCSLLELNCKTNDYGNVSKYSIENDTPISRGTELIIDLVPFSSKMKKEE